jgi:response regulator RpfG family c-di-GMP phosphodiesterase
VFFFAACRLAIRLTSFMAKLIRSLGYEVMTTTDPTTTSLYQLSASDIVFIDILMPVMDGLEVLKTLSGVLHKPFRLANLQGILQAER